MGTKRVGVEEESTVLRRVGQFLTSDPRIARLLEDEILPEARREHVRLRGQQGARLVGSGGNQLTQQTEV